MSLHKNFLVSLKQKELNRKILEFHLLLKQATNGLSMLLRAKRKPYSCPYLQLKLRVQLFLPEILCLFLYFFPNYSLMGTELLIFNRKSPSSVCLYALKWLWKYPCRVMFLQIFCNIYLIDQNISLPTGWEWGWTGFLPSCLTKTLQIALIKHHH